MNLQAYKIKESPLLSTVGLMLTYKCTLACPYCFINAIKDTKEEMTLESAYLWLNQLSLYKDGIIRNISLSGGESFCNLPYLLNVADYAYGLGFVVLVNTNAIWATSKDEALRVLQLCFSIETIVIHTDVKYQNQIPLENIENIVWAANKLGKNYLIEIDADNIENEEYLILKDRIFAIAGKNLVKCNYISIEEKAIYGSKNNHYKQPPLYTPMVCAKSSFPTIYPNGNVIACKGAPINLPDCHPLFLGNLNQDTLCHIFEKAESNILLNALCKYGPIKLVEFIKENGYEQILPNYYNEEAVCNICYKLFSNKIICEALKDLLEKKQWAMEPENELSSQQANETALKQITINL